MGLMVAGKVDFLSIEPGPTPLTGLLWGRGPAHISVALEASKQVMAPHPAEELPAGIGTVGEHVQTHLCGPAHRGQQIQCQPGLFAEVGGSAVLGAQIKSGAQGEAQGAGDRRPHHPQRHPTVTVEERPGALVFARVVMKVIGEAGDPLARLGNHAVIDGSPDDRTALRIAGPGQRVQQQHPELIQQRGRAPTGAGAQTRVDTLGLRSGGAAGDGRAGAPALAQHQRADVLTERLKARFRKDRCKSHQYRSYDFGQNEGLGHGRRPRWRDGLFITHHLPLVAVGPLSFTALLPPQNGRTID
jgi:hypothetical protein